MKKRRPAHLSDSKPQPSQDIRVPQQRRSKLRADVIVKVSHALIAKHGILGLKMSEIAEKARIPIGSVYQYFPTKSGLISHLFGRNLETYHDLARRCFGRATDVAECAAAIRHVTRQVYRDNRRDELMREIWSGVQADRTIRQLHVADNEFFSQILFDTIWRVGSKIPRQRLFRRCQIVNEMWDGTIRLAITLEQRAAAKLVDEGIELGLIDLGVVERGAL
jgi:AcrR family transcriptional regulator